jgi:hypothetical protein
MKSILGAVAAAALLTGCGGDGEGENSGPDPNAVSDKRAPEVAVTVRDDAGESVADVGYDTSNGRVPTRGTWASLQTLDGDTWSTAYTLSSHLDNGFTEGAPEVVTSDAYGGPGPDTYRLPDLDADSTYRICISFVIRHKSANGCSAPFHSS